MFDTLEKAQDAGFIQAKAEAKTTCSAMCGVAANVVTKETDYKLAGTAIVGGQYAKEFEAQGPYRVNSDARGYFNVFGPRGSELG